MKQIGWRVLQTIISFFILLMLCSNAAQPGVWNAGGGGFNLLFPEDSSAFRKIQMQREAIAIQLYPGFGVVKGTYHMRNSTADTIKIKVGYPVQGVYYGQQRKNFDFEAELQESSTYFSAIDELSRLSINEQLLSTYEEADPYAVQQISIIKWFWMGILIGLPALVVLLVISGRYFMRRRRSR